ncbi:MAG TPA: hypothetical protein VFH51_14165 [Myxococcota bacterium]|nr:hypothetical protein [Myxococcota bacterium]
MTCKTHQRPSWKCDDCAAAIEKRRNDDPLLHERCKAMLSLIQRDAMLRQGDGVADLVAFVMAERGRRDESRLAHAVPVVLYFGSEKDRDEFIEAVHSVKPNLITKNLP